MVIWILLRYLQPKPYHKPKLQPMEKQEIILTEVHVTRIYSDGSTQTYQRRIHQTKPTGAPRILAQTPNGKLSKFENHYQFFLRVNKKKLNKQKLLNEAVKYASTLVFGVNEKDL